MREELKIDACPFCGGEGEDDCVNAVHCACGAAMQVPYTGQKTSRKAITAWNTRAKPPQGDVGADSGLAAADDNHKALVEALECQRDCCRRLKGMPNLTRLAFREALAEMEVDCSKALAAFQSRQEESR